MQNRNKNGLEPLLNCYLATFLNELLNSVSEVNLSILKLEFDYHLYKHSKCFQLYMYM